MTNEIEKRLFARAGMHAVVAITLAEQRLTVSVAPWKELKPVATAEFAEVRITSIGVNPADPDELNLPWGLIGIDCYPMADQRWRFVLCCIGVEYGFEARWPQLLTNPPAEGPGHPGGADG